MLEIPPNFPFIFINRNRGQYGVAAPTKKVLIRILSDLATCCRILSNPVDESLYEEEKKMTNNLD
jgi:hypothetical protein